MNGDESALGRQAGRQPPSRIRRPALARAAGARSRGSGRRAASPIVARVTCGGTHDRRDTSDGLRHRGARRTAGLRVTGAPPPSRRSSRRSPGSVNKMSRRESCAALGHRGRRHLRNRAGALRRRRSRAPLESGRWYLASGAWEQSPRARSGPLRARSLANAGHACPCVAPLAAGRERGAPQR